MHGSRMHDMCVFQTMTLKRICTGVIVMSTMRFEYRVLMLGQEVTCWLTDFQQPCCCFISTYK